MDSDPDKWCSVNGAYGVSRVTCNREPGPPISMSKVRGPGVEATVVEHVHH